MGMLVMGIREMRMRMAHGRVAVMMGMASSGCHGLIMLVVMMVVAFAVDMLVGVLKHPVRVPVLVPFRQV